MADKVEIINLLRRGQSGKEIARRCDAEEATTSCIKKNVDSIQLLVSTVWK
jgi:DNA-binding NarL/FixJ family response regulator